MIKDFLDKIRGKWWTQPPQYLLVFFLIVGLLSTVSHEDMMGTRWVLMGMYIFTNLILARIDDDKIEEGKKICHGLNAAIYALLVSASFLITHSYLPLISYLLIRIPVFNTALNVMRGLPATYVSKYTTSLIDKWTYKIVNKLGYWTYNIIILGLSILLICHQF